MQEGVGGLVIPHSGLALRVCKVHPVLLKSTRTADGVSSLCKTEEGLSSFPVYVYRGIKCGEITLLEMLDPLAHMLCSSSVHVL